MHFIVGLKPSIWLQLMQVDINGFNSSNYLHTSYSKKYQYVVFDFKIVASQK